MNDEPDIIKELREEERLGKLRSASYKVCDQEKKPKEQFTESPTGTILIPEPKKECVKESYDVETNEAMYKTIFDVFPESIALVDNKGTIININNQTREWLGFQPKDLIGKNLMYLPIFPQHIKEKVKQHLSELMLSKDIPPYEIEFVNKQGKQRIGLVRACHIKTDAQDVIANLIVITDITERKKMEEDMRIKDSAITSSINAIALADLDGNLSYVNKSFLDMWGYEKEQDILGKPMINFWKIKGKYAEVMDILFTKGEWVGELTGLRKDRSTFQVQLSANMISDEFKKPICLMGSFVDITKYKRTVKALSVSEKKFRVVLDNSLDMIYQLNLNAQTYEYVSPSSLSITGYTSEEIATFGFEKVKTLIHPDDLEKLLAHYTKVSTFSEKFERIQSVEYRIKHRTLGYRWMSDTCSAIFDEKNQATAIVGNVEDITERKKVWNELVKSEEKYRVLAETSADGVFTTDALGRLTYVNPSFEKLCGRRKSKILATPFRNYLMDESVYFFQQIFIEVRKKNEKIENIELELVSNDEAIIPIEVNIAPLKKGVEFTGVVCTARDITQRREVEEELKKSERLKTEFMNIVAHELRSPVTPIKGYLDLILHDTDSNDKIKNWAKIGLRNAERLLKLVNDILDVSRLDSDTMRFEMEKIDPFTYLSEIAEDMRPIVTNKGLEFNVNIEKKLPNILGDRNRLSQVLKNLLGNALKFTDYGSITISAEKKENHILITVADTGIGISKDELKKIFTKFYQAYTGDDRNNEGTGLGLFICKEIVRKHNGRICAESEVGKGSKFIIELPYIYKMTVDFSKKEETIPDSSVKEVE